MPVFTARCAGSRGRYAPSPTHKPSNKLSIEGMIYDAIMAPVLSHLGQSLGEPMSWWRTFINESMFLILSFCSNILSFSFFLLFVFLERFINEKGTYSRRWKRILFEIFLLFFFSFFRDCRANFQICKDMSIRYRLGVN